MGNQAVAAAYEFYDTVKCLSLLLLLPVSLDIRDKAPQEQEETRRSIARPPAPPSRALFPPSLFLPLKMFAVTQPQTSGIALRRCA